MCTCVVNCSFLRPIMYMFVCISLLYIGLCKQHIKILLSDLFEAPAVSDFTWSIPSASLERFSAASADCSANKSSNIAIYSTSSFAIVIKTLRILKKQHDGSHYSLLWSSVIKATTSTSARRGSRSMSYSNQTVWRFFLIPNGFMQSMEFSGRVIALSGIVIISWN